jgi:hypothetical protein
MHRDNLFTLFKPISIQHSLYFDTSTLPADLYSVEAQTSESYRYAQRLAVVRE